ncbi:MAG TPA: cytochrome D1 domain-containing protein [Candidatus Sulfotelmatobacter sp.]|nr:cytochrome D1 domain-containing protein [Candidatus Sulfotelmatobacter sp.]
MRCYDCHSTITTRFRLQAFLPGDSSWTEEQSRQNFEIVSQLVAPGDPLSSRLLVHPLAQEAGGDPAHAGGKFWKSQQDPEWQTLTTWVRGSSRDLRARQPASPATDVLSFQTFKSQVEPIFLKERPGHARCYGCHSEYNRSFHLEKLSPGAASWTAEQSQRNFQNILQHVVPGDPAASRLLIHPLAPEAGGDPFHSGGYQFQSQNDPDWLVIAEWMRGARTQTNADSSHKPVALIYVTNSAGDTIDVIDPTTNAVVQVIHGIELPHGITFSPDGKRVYVSNESESLLDVVDQKSGEILQKVPLSGRPNNIAITKDGRRILAGIRAPQGALDVIDTVSLTRVKSIPVDSVHNVYVTPDGKYAVSGSLEGQSTTVTDLQTGQTAWRLNFDHPVRPMAFEVNPDGSTRRIFVQLSNFNGFAVVDFTKRSEVARITLPNEPGGFGIAEGRVNTPAHGIGVAPDGRSLWVNSTLANAVFEYTLPELKLVGHTALPLVHPMGHAPTGSVPEWITFTPDSEHVYVSNSGGRSVSAIDTKTLKLVAVIPVGEVPKRINTLILH